MFIEGAETGFPQSFHTLPTNYPPACRQTTKTAPFHSPSTQHPHRGRRKLCGNFMEAPEIGKDTIGKGISADNGILHSFISAQNLSPGVEFRGIWIILGRFWRVEGLDEGSVKVGRARGVWGSRKDVGRGGYGEEIEGCRDRESGESGKVAGSGDRKSSKGVVEEERSGSGGWGEKLGEDCRDSGAGASSQSEQQTSEDVETACEEELLRQSRSKHRGVVVRVSAGKLAGGSGQPSPCGRRPEVPLYDSLETCPRPRSDYGWSRGRAKRVVGEGKRQQAARARDTAPRIS